MIRAPLWLIVLLVLAIVGLGVYGYFTTPLPFGLSSVIQTPGGGAVTPATGTRSTPAGTRTVAGQPLVLGATNVVIQSVQRNEDLSAGGRSGPAGSFTVVEIEVQNGGSEPLTPQLANFRLIDDRGRVYAVDPEATRTVNTTGRRRMISESTVPPAGRVNTLLAFETPADATALTLRVSLGYGELELPR